MAFDASPFSGDFRIPRWFAGSPITATKVLGSWESRDPITASSEGGQSTGPGSQYGELEDWEAYEEETVIPPQDPISSGRVMADPKDAQKEKEKDGNGAIPAPKPWLLVGGVVIAALLLGR
jgi:hypothetical protein